LLRLSQRSATGRAAAPVTVHARRVARQRRDGRRACPLQAAKSPVPLRGWS